MTVPQKQCPRCGTLAPLDATFCGQCGRQYKTQFTPSGAGVSGAAPAPVYNIPSPNYAPRTPSVWMLRAVQGLIAAVVCFAVLAYFGIFRHDTKGNAPIAISTPVAPPRAAAPASQAAQAHQALSEDPIESEARRAVDRESKKLSLPPPVSQDGKIHLRSGGTITQEEWEAASRKAQESPVMRNTPMMPPL